MSIQIPRWCAECSHYFPKDGTSSLCGLRKCTMKPDFHREGIDDSATIEKDCGALQGWRGKRLLDVIGEVHEREARAAELQAMTKKKRAKHPIIGDPKDIPVIKSSIPEPVMKRSDATNVDLALAGIRLERPTTEQIERAKACQHLHQAEFIDYSFSGIGVMCTDCQLLIRWITKPDWLADPKSKHDWPADPKTKTKKEKTLDAWMP
jgi:hypothetical protein